MFIVTLRFLLELEDLVEVTRLTEAFQWAEQVRFLNHSPQRKTRLRKLPNGLEKEKRSNEHGNHDNSQSGATGSTGDQHDPLSVG
jgi:hypothetical protein